MRAEIFFCPFLLCIKAGGVVHEELPGWGAYACENRVIPEIYKEILI